MAFKVLGDTRDLEQIWVATDSEATITGVERQDTLFAAGFHFEAARSRPMLKKSGYPEPPAFSKGTRFAGRFQCSTR